MQFTRLCGDAGMTPAPYRKRHCYVTGERRPFRTFWKPGRPMIEPLAVPEFVPTRWRRREQAIVL